MLPATVEIGCCPSFFTWVCAAAVAVDGVFDAFTDGADEVAVGVCRPVVGDSGRLALSNLRSRSRFLGFPSDIFRYLAVK